MVISPHRAPTKTNHKPGEWGYQITVPSSELPIAPHDPPICRERDNQQPTSPPPFRGKAAHHHHLAAVVVADLKSLPSRQVPGARQVARVLQGTHGWQRRRNVGSRPVGNKISDIMNRSEESAGGGLFERYVIQGNVRSIGRLDLTLRCLVRLLRKLRSEAASRTGLPWRHRMRAWRLGFTSESAALYEVDSRNHSSYVPCYVYALRCYAMNGFLNPIVSNKLVVSQVLAANGISHPHVFGLICNGEPRSVGTAPSGSKNRLLELWTEDARPVVFRPHWSGGGEGVFFLRREGHHWFINGRAAPEADVRRLIASLNRYIATAFVDQASYARRIYPDTSNTIRVLTLSDADGPFVASAVHRFGTTRSFPIDNFHHGTGGVCAAVDLATQRLGKAVTLNSKNQREWYGTHPQTGAQIEGVTIPGLSQGLDAILTAMRCFPEATCVGWDLLMTDGGYSILEANAPPGIEVCQVHTPLLSDPRAARVFRSYGI